MKNLIFILISFIQLTSFSLNAQPYDFSFGLPNHRNLTYSYFNEIVIGLSTESMSCEQRLNFINNTVATSLDRNDILFVIASNTSSSEVFRFSGKGENQKNFYIEIRARDRKSIARNILVRSEGFLGLQEFTYVDGIMDYHYNKSYKHMDVDIDQHDTESGYSQPKLVEKYHLDFEHYPYDENVIKIYDLFGSTTNSFEDTVLIWDVEYIGYFDGDKYSKKGKKSYSFVTKQSHQINKTESKFGWWEYYKNDELFLRRKFFDYESKSAEWRREHRTVNKIINEIWTAKKIPLIKYGNLNYVTLNIGGNDYDFLLDTGASDVLINSEIEQHLLNTGVLRTTDYLETVKYTFADGSSKYFKTANLYSVKIGDTSFSNINVAIGDSNSSLLLGMSFLNKFDWKINGDVLELTEKR